VSGFENFYIMKKYLFLAFQLFAITLASQVTTRIVQENTFRDYVKKHAFGGVTEHKIPRPNVEQVLNKDAREGHQLQRFAIKISTNITKKNGVFFETNSTINWKLAVLSEGATSLNFHFRDIHFPDGTVMYIYSKNRRMIIGPITEKNVHDGVFASDIVYGEHAIIEVIMPKGSIVEYFDLKLNSVSYGISPNAFADSTTRGFGDALPCNNDINCAVGDPWANVRDGVARIQVGGEDHCSGSLVTDECESGRSYFLTAFHCFEGNEDLTNWTFQFFYESPTCDGAEPTNWVSFSGADFRAGWADSDFLLLELRNRTEITPNRVSHVPNGEIDDDLVACIHHPLGDVKKISLDDGLVVVDNDWVVEQWDDGVVQHGSSGGPLFDKNQLIIGQVHGGDNNIGCSNDGGLVDNGTFGRTNVSWLGGGTDETSLAPWLGNGLPPDNPNNNTHIIGPDVLCKSGNFCVNKNVSLVGWEITPSSPFVTNIWSGGECLGVEVQNTNYSGWATIHFWGPIEYGECFPGPSVDLSKTIWVGAPHMPEVQFLNCENELMLWFDENYILPEDTGIMWETWNEVFGHEVWINTQEINLDFFQGSYQYKLTVSNTCGKQIVEGIIEKGDTNCKWPQGGFTINPNPVENSVFVLLDIRRYSEQDKKTIKIYNQFGNLELQYEIMNNEFEMDISSLSSGQYFVQITSQEKIATQKFIKI